MSPSLSRLGGQLSVANTRKCQRDDSEFKSVFVFISVFVFVFVLRGLGGRWSVANTRKCQTEDTSQRVAPVKAFAHTSSQRQRMPFIWTLHCWLPKKSSNQPAGQFELSGRIYVGRSSSQLEAQL